MLTLQIGQTLTPEADVTINLAPVSINLKNTVNVQGGGIVLEAGQGFLGTSAMPVTVNVFSGGSVTARALDNIYVAAPESDIPVGAMYSASGGVYLVASSSIYDAIVSDFAKIQANSINLVAWVDRRGQRRRHRAKRLRRCMSTSSAATSAPSLTAASMSTRPMAT